jgi:chitodextrinase
MDGRQQGEDHDLSLWTRRVHAYTQHDVVNRALQTADVSGAQVYLGLQINDDWWTNYIFDKPWLDNEAKVANALADDLWKHYGRHESLRGWYLGFEVDNVASTPADWNNLVAFYQTVANHLHKLTPSKPVVIAPFFDTKSDMSSSQWETMWKYVLKRSPIDVLALQDGIGAGHATKAQVPEWFGAVQRAIQHSRPRMRLWAETETYLPGYVPMPIHSIVNDMRAEQCYVTNFLSFSFNHYMSPQQVNPLYYKTYFDYFATGKVEQVRPTTPTDLTSVVLDSYTVQLAWAASTDNVGVAGYKVLRDGRYTASKRDGTAGFADEQLAPDTTYTYQVKAFDAAGNQSGLSNITTVTTPPPHLYPTNIALGRPYTSTMPASSSYPDTDGVELTDGVSGSIDFSEPAWQGRAAVKTYAFTIDLGSEQVIKEIRSDWLQDEGSGILLPQGVIAATSSDNVNFTNVGTAKDPLLGNDVLSYWYTLTDLSNVNGRYVRVQVIPGPNAEWTFVDEIEVRQ